ncbi:MAG: motility protein A [Lachnospiraceae bacterium]|nr:motility protein A [Lachnospiraceae bacterium]
MDLASIIGLVLSFALMIFGMLNGGYGAAALGWFVDPPSVLITFGGAFGAVFASCSVQGFLEGVKSIGLVFKVPQLDSVGTIRQIIDLSNVARKEGLLALEESANTLEDPFMKKGIMLIVDGTDPELVRGILEAELVNTDVRHQANIAFWKQIGAMGPAWGMIGTLIGLVLMLQNLSDPDSIGPSMATALITTYYGSVLANWISAPVSGKLALFNDQEIQLKEIMIEGLLSIQAGENPRVIEEKLKSFLSPNMREGLSEGGE